MITNGVVTTSNDPSKKVTLQAQQVANSWGLPFEPRKKRSIDKLLTKFETTVFVVTANRIEVFSVNFREPFFFHPNGAMFRAKHWYRYGEDPLISACSIVKGDIVVDATLGLASDAQLLSLAVGEYGKVIGIEISPLIAQVVSEGLKTYNSSFEPLDAAMKRIEIICTDHEVWLQQQPTNSIDVIMFDPMFEEIVQKSNGFQSIRPYSHQGTLSNKSINEAKRVARKRVVLKDHYRSSRFQSLGFPVCVRHSATYQFGVLEIETSEKS